MNNKHPFRIFILFFLCQMCIFMIYAETRMSSHVNLLNREVNVTDGRLIEDSNPCYEFNTCAYNKLIYVPNCYCDELCRFHDDCCIDHESHQIDSSQKENGQEKESDRTDFGVSNLECKVLYGRDVGVFLVKNCPNDMKTSREESTANSPMDKFLEKIVVTGSDGVVYENKNIALCNKVTKFENWKIYFDFSFCFDDIDLGHVRDKSVKEIALYYYQLGCDFKVVPPEELLPRFCISFRHCWNSSSGMRMPVGNADATYLNEMCCKQFSKNPRCPCYRSSFQTYHQLDTRFGHSMVAMFQFKNSGGIQQENGPVDTPQSSPSSNVRIRNAIFRQTCIASVGGKIDLPVWLRAYMFYKLSLENALKQYNAVLSYVHSFWFLTPTNSNKGRVFGYTNVQINKDLVSFNAYLQLEAWLYEFHVTYTDVNDNETNVFNIFLQMIDDKEGYNCIRGSPNCTIFPLYGVEYDQSDALSKIKTSNQYPQRKCKHVQGLLKKNDKVYNLDVQCLATERLLSGSICLESNLSSSQHLIIMFACLVFSSSSFFLRQDN